MKRIFAGVSAIAILLTGCTAVPGTPGKTPNRMAGRFAAEVTLTAAENECHAVLTRYGTDAWCIELTDPPALDGVKLDFLDDEVTASYKGLEFSVPQSAQALRTEFAELMDAVDSFAALTELDTQTKDDALVCEGELETGSYTLTFPPAGTPVQFELPAYGLCIRFDAFHDENGAVTTETATIPKTYPVTDVPPETVTES